MQTTLVLSMRTETGRQRDPGSASAGNVYIRQLKLIRTLLMPAMSGKMLQVSVWGLLISFNKQVNL